MANKSTTTFVETKQAVDKIIRLVPKLTEGEKETLALLLDKEAMLDLQQSLKDAREGRVVSLEKAKKQLL